METWSRHSSLPFRGGCGGGVCGRHSAVGGGARPLKLDYCIASDSHLNKGKPSQRATCVSALHGLTLASSDFAFIWCQDPETLSLRAHSPFSSPECQSDDDGSSHRRPRIRSALKVSQLSQKVFFFPPVVVSRNSRHSLFHLRGYLLPRFLRSLSNTCSTLGDKVSGGARLQKNTSTAAHTCGKLQRMLRGSTKVLHECLLR